MTRGVDDSPHSLKEYDTPPQAMAHNYRTVTQQYDLPFQNLDNTIQNAKIIPPFPNGQPVDFEVFQPPAQNYDPFTPSSVIQEC
jgi:hypothetical protein